MEDCEKKVTLTEKDPSPRSMVQGEGSSSHDQPVAITDKSVVIESCPTTPPPPQPRPQPHIRDEFRSSIMNEGGESGETGESSNNTKPEHKLPRVPQMLRQMETKKYYDPQLVSIGPYHHNNTNLKSFEKFKIQFTREFVKSCDPPDITELYNKVAELAGEARSCYAEGTTEGIEDTAFTEMMFLDGCFILQFVWCIVNDEEGQLQMMKSHEIALVHRDLFLVENQLPFQVLLALMNMNLRFCRWRGKDLISRFIQKIRGKKPSFFKTYMERLFIEVCCNWSLYYGWELVDIYGNKQVHVLENTWADHIKYDHTISFRNRKIQGSGNIHHHQYPRRSAMDLKMVGIRFRPSHRDCLSCIAFKSTWTGGILILPKINIDETTISLLLNLAAYEHCPNTLANYLWATNYICFLDSIIDSANDVKELKYAGIITNFLRNDEEVVKVIGEMAAGLVPDYRNTSYFCVMSSIEEYHSRKGKTRIASWIAEVMCDHFRSPWTAIAVLAALFAIFLTTIQTYFAAFPRTDKCQESICNYLKNSMLKSNGG
ncbi:unnamed protein product [Camellia sinensis]